MTKQRKHLNVGTKREEDFFIGWAKAPSVDRRFLLGGIPAVVAASGGMGWLVAKELDDPGAGAWLTGATHEVTGQLVANPYPMMISDAGTDAQRTTLIVAQGKCTSALDLALKEGGTFKASGVLIERKGRQMLEVPLMLDDWLTPVADTGSARAVQAETVIAQGVSLAGTIMDTKCFFGVMRPGYGQTHKACASLCIRGGIPPSFWARTKDGRESVLLMTDRDGGPLGEDILPLVAEPVSSKGDIVQVGDLLHFRADASDFRLIKA
jgi:hypothetical protein